MSAAYAYCRPVDADTIALFLLVDGRFVTIDSGSPDPTGSGHDQPTPLAVIAADYAGELLDIARAVVAALELT
jgi:hypothetical protein